MIKISSVVIGVQSLIKARSFYENVFGITFLEFRPPFASFELDGVEFNIEEDSTSRKPDWQQLYIGGRKSIAFEVDNLEEFLDKALLNKAQIIQTIEEKPWGYKESVIADLDGNQFLIEQKLEAV